MRERTRAVNVGGARMDPVVAAVAAALAAFLLAGWAAPWLSSHTSARVQLDPSRYQLVVPGVKATGKSLAKVAKSGLVDGSLALETRAFGAPERLVPQTERVVDLQMRLAPGSDPVLLNARTADGNQMQIATFSVEGWQSPNGVSRAYVEPGVAHVRFEGGQAVVDGERVIAAAGGGVELAPMGSARIAWLRLADGDGAVLLEDDFATPAGPSSRFGWGFAAAAGVGLAAYAIARPGTSMFGRIVLVIAALIPVLVVRVPYAGWTALVERLYLGDADMGELRRGAVALAAGPLFAMATSMSGALDLSKSRVPPLSWGVVFAVEGAVALLASRGLSGMGWALLPVGLLAAWLPLRAAKETRATAGACLLRDVPALLLLAGVGLGGGLLPAVLWRFLTLWADVPRLLEQGARAGADAFLALVLLSPVATEAALRGTSVDHTWDADVLAGASVGGPAMSAMDVPFWSATCGDREPANVYAFGGSSTGGAWQFRGDPTAFFPAHLHQRLCEAGLSIRSLNYGEGGRDSFDVAMGGPPLFATNPPAVVILYLGVNDLLTRDSPLTRQQRADTLSKRSETTGAIDALSSRSRLFTGLGLLVRPQAEPVLVQAVPLPDAEANIRTIVAAATGAGGKVLLVPELTRAAERAEVQGYADMLTRLARELPGATLVDARTAIGPALDVLMTDRNHLSAEGGDALAAAMVPAVRGALEANP